MSRINLLSMCICLMIIGGCHKKDTVENIITGIIGRVKYGEGDCFPGGSSKKILNDYNGKIYFVNKDQWDNLSEGDYEIFLAQFKENSISANIKKGKLSVSLPAGTYYVVIDDNYVDFVWSWWTGFYTIAIIEQYVLNKDFDFFYCSSM